MEGKGSQAMEKNHPVSELMAETIEKIALFAAKETGLAVAPTMAITGVNVLKSNPEAENGYSEYGMFPITDAVCTVKGDQI